MQQDKTRYSGKCSVACEQWNMSKTVVNMFFNSPDIYFSYNRHIVLSKSNKAQRGGFNIALNA